MDLPSEMQSAFISALLKKDNKRTEVDRFDISQFFGHAGLYHSKLLQSISSFATVDICKTDLIIYAQHEMVGLQYWFLLQGEVRLYSSKKAHFQFIKSGNVMQTTRDSLAELGKCEYIVQQGDFFGVESFLHSNPHVARPHSALVTKDGTIILPIQGATPIRHAFNFIRFPHQYQVHTLSHWCKIAPELRSDHEVTLILHHLKGFSFFSKLSDHLGLSWAKMCVLVNVRAQTLLFRQNDPSDSMYFIIDGSCQVRLKKLNEAVENATSSNINLLTIEADYGECVHTFESGESFGELSLDHAKPNQIPRRTASIICVQDSVLLRVDAEAYYTLQKMGQSSRIILSQWTKPFQVVAGSRSSETVEMLSVIMLDFKYFSFMNELTRRILAQNMFLIDAQPGDIIFLEGEPVFKESMPTESDIMPSNIPNIPRSWTTDSVCAVLHGSIGAYKKRKSTESSFHVLESYLYMKSTQKIETLSDTFGQLQTTIIAGEGFGEELLHRKSSEVKRNFSYVCLEASKLLFYGRETFSATLGPSHDLGSGKTKLIMRKPHEQRTYRDTCIIFRELSILPFIQNFVEHDFHDFFSKAKFGNFPAFAVISNIFPKHCFGIILSGAMSVHQSEEEPVQTEVKNVKDTQCHAIRLMFGACKHLVKEGDIFGEYNLKSFAECTKMSSKIIPSRCTYITRIPTEIIYWDIVDLNPKLLEDSKQGIGSPHRVIQIMAKPFNQRTDDDSAVIDEFLRSFRFFCQYPDLSRIISSPAFCMRVLDASDVIFKESEAVSYLYVLLQGSIQIQSKLKPEPEVFSSMSVFGEMSVEQFHSIGSRLMTCTAADRATCFLQIPFEAFLQLEKLKMVSIYRRAKAFLLEHHCFKMLASKSSLIDELISGCHILCKSKNESCYLEGRFYERSIWAVLTGSVELVLTTDSELKNSDDSVLDVKINSFGKSANSSAKAAFSKQSAIRHSLALLTTGAAFAPFAVDNDSKKTSRSYADHDAVAAENDTIVVVFFMKHSEYESTTAMCLVEQEIAFLSRWRQFRKTAGDHAIANSLSSSISSPKSVSKTPKSLQRYRTVRPKTGLEGKIDTNLLLPKLPCSRDIDTIHNNDILNINADYFSVSSDASLEQILVKLLQQSEEAVTSTAEVSKSCPSPPEGNNCHSSDCQKTCPESDSVEINADVEKKILNIFAADKFKRKVAMTPVIGSEISSGMGTSAPETKDQRSTTSGLSESKSKNPLSPESPTTERITHNRDPLDEVFADHDNVASKIAAIMSGNKFKQNTSHSQMESSISETLEAARQISANVEPAWKGKVVEILKTDVFQRTAEDPESILQHALSVAAELAQKERESRLPKEKILIDAFCKRVREQMLLGEAVDCLAFNQSEIYVPEKPVRSFGRNRISDTANKLIAQETQTKFGADHKASNDFRIHRPQLAASSLQSLRNRQIHHDAINSRKGNFPNSNQLCSQNWNRSLSVSKIVNDDFMPRQLIGLSLARVSTPVIHLDSFDTDFNGSHPTSSNLNLQPDSIVSPKQASFDHLESDLNQGSHYSPRIAHGSVDSALSRETRIVDKQSSQTDPELQGKKCTLHDYLFQIAQNPELNTKLKKAFNSSNPSKASLFTTSNSTLMRRNTSKLISDDKQELSLSGRSKAMYSVTELASMSRWQNLQASDSIRTSQYRPILMKAQPITQNPDSCARNSLHSVSIPRQVSTLQDPMHAFGAEQRLAKNMHTWSSHSINPHSPATTSAVSSSKPKSRGYSSHGTPGLAFDAFGLPPLNVVLNPNSPNSSKPQTPHLKPWSPNDSRSPSRAASSMRNIGCQPHVSITGIALDDGVSFNGFEAPRT